MLLINRLKSYKLTLEEIKSITGSMEVSSEKQIFSALLCQKSVLQGQIDKISTIIHQIDFDIQQMKAGKSIMSYLLDIDVKRISICLSPFLLSCLYRCDICVGAI